MQENCVVQMPTSRQLYCQQRIVHRWRFWGIAQYCQQRIVHRWRFWGIAQLLEFSLL